MKLVMWSSVITEYLDVIPILPEIAGKEPSTCGWFIIALLALQMEVTSNIFTLSAFLFVSHEFCAHIPSNT